jgi:hypothetical protein
MRNEYGTLEATTRTAHIGIIVTIVMDQKQK